MSKYPKFEELVARVAKQQGRDPFVGKLLAIDPGETTGLAEFDKGTLVRAWQIPTKTVEQGAEVLSELIRDGNYSEIVVEEYRVFSWRTKQHSWSALHTPQLIGFIRGALALLGLKPVMQTPQNAKGFVTNDKLKDWDMYIKGQTHARDATRHGCFFLLFGKKGRNQ